MNIFVMKKQHKVWFKKTSTDLNSNFDSGVSYGSWIYNYLCNQWLSPLKLWARIPHRGDVLDTLLCDKVCQWCVAGQWFSQGTLVSSTNKTNGHDITEILLA